MSSNASSAFDKLVVELSIQLSASEYSDNLRLVSGNQIRNSDLPEVALLNANGASWDWVALTPTMCNFWDFHIGLLPVSDESQEFSLGIHWLPRQDRLIRPWATALLPAGEIHVSVATGEYQLSDPVRRATHAETAEQALAIAAKAFDFFSSRPR
jgi:hypothetical protein